MRPRFTAIQSEYEFFSKPRLEDIIPYQPIRRQKSLTLKETESELNMDLKINCLNECYNNKPMSPKKNVLLDEVCIDLFKNSIKSKEDTIFFYQQLKKDKRKISQSLAQEISTKQIIEEIMLLSKDAKKIQYQCKLDNDDNDENDELGCHDHGVSITNSKTLGGHYNSTSNIKSQKNKMLSQNIIPEQSMKMMLISSDNDQNANNLIKSIIDKDTNHSFEMPHKILNLNKTQRVLVLFYNTTTVSQQKDIIQFYGVMDAYIYFINHKQNIEKSKEEIKDFMSKLFTMNNQVKPVVIVGKNTSNDLINFTKDINESIVFFDVNTIDEFTKKVFPRVIINTLLRMPNHPKSYQDNTITNDNDIDSDIDSDYGNDGANLVRESGYKVDSEDNDDYDEDDGLCSISFKGKKNNEDDNKDTIANTINNNPSNNTIKESLKKISKFGRSKSLGYEL